MASPKRLHFSTHAELKNIIGQDLINDDNIAIIELVKNGFDAGSKNVALTFFDEMPGGCGLIGPAILIGDEGSGMSESDVVEKWLNIAYSEKKELKVPGRVLAGNKGVGRFACDRLGTRLDMFTKQRGGALLHVRVDWTAFENKKKFADTIQKVTVLQTEITPAEMQAFVGQKIGAKGTLLAVSGLRQDWDREHLLSLKRHLERFVNPIAAFDQASVEIVMRAPAQAAADRHAELHQRVNGTVNNQVFEKLKFRTTYVTLDLAEDGQALTTELFHEGARVYRLVEEREDLSPLRGVSVVLHYMNPYKKAYFKRETGLHLVDFGSIFLFLNGYRVPPYGDRDNDWLGVDSRKAQATRRNLGARELLGHINVADSAAKFRVVSNREGVVRDPAFVALTSREGLFYLALTRLERFVVDGLNWDSVPEQVRRRLQVGELPGIGEMPDGEVYDESQDRKRRRIAMDVLRIVGASPSLTKELQIDPTILDALSREREEDVQGLLERFGAFDEASVGQDVRLALGRVQKEFERQRDVLVRTREDSSRKGRQVERLKTVARGISEKNVKLEQRVQTQQSELMFSRVASGSDQEQLMLLHHQSGIYAHTTQNFLEKALFQFRQGNAEKGVEFVEKALNSAAKVVTVTNFATKANFRLKAASLKEDITRFIREYLMNVAKETSAQTLRLTVESDSSQPFIMSFKPIDLAIVFDNIASNSVRSGAKELDISMTRPSEDELRIEVTDNGPGLSKAVQPPDSIFERGVTTTSGSGLGLYHVRDTVKQMGGTIQVNEGTESGFSLIIRLFK